jgi:uncharacterized protein
MRVLALAALLLAAPATLAAPPALAQSQNQPLSLVSVTGTGEVERVPDFARIFISVVNRADTIAEAVEANNDATARALARLEELGVAREDIATSNFQVSETPERRDRNGNILPDPAYTASHQLRVVSRDIEGVGQLAGEVLALDGMTFQSIAWGLDRSEEAQDEARRLAVADARRQADVLTEAAGVALGEIHHIGDAHMSFGPRPEMDNVMMMRSATAQAVPIVPPAFVRHAASVRVEWRIAR